MESLHREKGLFTVDQKNFKKLKGSSFPKSSEEVMKTIDKNVLINKNNYVLLRQLEPKILLLNVFRHYCHLQV